MASTTYSMDPVLYLYTSLTSGSSHIVTATSRLETILKANKIPFRAIDIATDEKARMLWGRRAGKDESGRVRKIPGLVQMGLVLGDLVEIEDWNEYGELKQHVKIVPLDASGNPAKAAASPAPASPLPKPAAPKNTDAPSKAATSDEAAKTNTPEAETAKAAPPPAGASATPFALAMRGIGEEAAQKAKEAQRRAMHVLSGAGQARESEQAAHPPNTVPAPLTVTKAASTRAHTMIATAPLQSPTTSSWSRPSFLDEEEVSSPLPLPGSSNTVPLTAAVHRSSSVSQASAKEIRKVEGNQAIKEEVEEDADDDDEEEDEDEDEDEDDDDDDDDDDESA
ncbi:MAG: hypothetical protein M1818_008264 [Claussenomyces sp. TS43310]|nr:MAG: hypothetical protein M1818_008264 [Claussenomyces sp. TS43310]